MRELMRADGHVSLSVCLSGCKFVYTCMCVCPNEGLIGTLCACCETCLTILAPESWKSVSVRKGRRLMEWFLAGPRR